MLGWVWKQFSFLSRYCLGSGLALEMLAMTVLVLRYDVDIAGPWKGSGFDYSVVIMVLVLALS